ALSPPPVFKRLSPLFKHSFGDVFTSVREQSHATGPPHFAFVAGKYEIVIPPSTVPVTAYCPTDRADHITAPGIRLITVPPDQQGFVTVFVKILVLEIRGDDLGRNFCRMSSFVCGEALLHKIRVLDSSFYPSFIFTQPKHLFRLLCQGVVQIVINAIAGPA